MARDRVPSFFILVPGPFPDAEEVVRVLARRGIEAKPRDGSLDLFLPLAKCFEKGNAKP